VTSQEVLNYESQVAYKMTPERVLYTAVVTASLSNTFYEKENDRLTRIVELIGKVDPLFVAQLAIYTRQKMHLRSVSVVLIAELAKIYNGDSLVRKSVSKVVQRADEITELLSYYQMTNARTETKKLNRLSKQVQKGLAEAFNRFDEYQFAKYNRNTQVKLKDALFLTHPKAKDEAQQLLFNKIANDALEVPYTWEVELSKVGQQSYTDLYAKQEAVSAKWEELIDSNRLGYMALMRNLRNILQASVSTKHLKIVGARLSDAAAVAKAKQMPFRFLSAYRELQELDMYGVSYIMDCLEKAVQHAAANVKGFDLDTRVLLAADVSGSMFSPVSQKSKIRCYDVGLMLSMLMRNRSENVTTGIFGHSWKAVNLPKSSILANTQQLNKIEGSVGYTTNAYIVIREMIETRKVYDKVMFFTDLQLWDSSGAGNSLKEQWNIYTQRVAPGAKLYLFDLLGYGQAPLKTTQNNVYLIAGWSEKIFDVLNAIENGRDALSEIKRVEV
jgi:hypothetical protein